MAPTVHKPLSTQAIKKLEQMSEAQKIRLLARLILIKQNNRLTAISNIVLHDEWQNRPAKYPEVDYTFGEVKAELLHHLYDQNENYEQGDKYTHMQKFLGDSSVNLYDVMDNFTMIAYVLYYSKMLKLCQKYNVRTLYDLREAKDNAYLSVAKYLDLSKMHFEYDPNMPKIPSSFMQACYRKSLFEYLKNDLKFDNEYAFLYEVATGRKYIKTKTETKQPTPNYKEERYSVYANQVEVYYQGGQCYYMDSEGNLYPADQVGDFNYGEKTIKATPNGFVEEYSNDYDKSY